MLQIGDGGTTGSIVGDVNVTSGEELAFNRSDTITFTGVISGTGDLLQIGTGTTVLTGTNTYTGGTTISAGTLQIGDGGTAGSIVGNVATSGVLAFNRTDAVTFGGVMSGAGTLSQLGAGTLTLTGTNTYTGGTTISAGTLQVGNGGTTGALGHRRGGEQRRADLQPQRRADGGERDQRDRDRHQAGRGHDDADRRPTPTPAARRSARARCRSATAARPGTLGTGAVINNATLAFNRSDALTVANVISGTGTLIQSGTGTTTLTGDQHLHRRDDDQRRARCRSGTAARPGASSAT